MTNDQYNTPFVLWHASFSRHLSFDIRRLAIHFPLSTLFVGLLSSSLVCAAGDQPPLKVAEHEGRLFITAGDVPVATYVFRDAEIARPHFAHVHAPGGLQVTRHHPPRAGVDPTDHATMHPGVWLAFGDISGSDFWRNKGRVEHLEFVEPPRAKTDGPDSIVSFAAKYRYVAGGKTICQELARHTIRAARGGYWFTFDSTFTGEDAFAFGDQEEMGLGIRLAIPFVVKAGNGTITSSAGGKNEKQVWGQPADWCDYSGIDIERKLRGGLLLVPHPENFRRSWMHARDYGLVVANPFGQNAFKQGPKNRVEVIPGEQLHLRFGVWSYAADLNQPVDHAALAAEYVQMNRR